MEKIVFKQGDEKVECRVEIDSTREIIYGLIDSSFIKLDGYNYILDPEKMDEIYEIVEDNYSGNPDWDKKYRCTFKFYHKTDIKKSKLKWYLIYIVYNILALILGIVVALLCYVIILSKWLSVFTQWLTLKVEKVKIYLIVKYKP